MNLGLLARRRNLRRVLGGVCVLGLAGVASGLSTTPLSAQESYQRISGEGSSWAANAIDAMRVNVRQFGITVDYNPSGSTSGRKNFLNGTVDFAASDIPFQFAPEDGSAPENPAPGSYAYMPITAGGTAFMYNLKINGKRVTNLRLSGENVAKIFTGVIKTWNDPALVADNPGITLPGRAIVPVVRSDGSGSSAQFTKWMIATHGAIWTDYCNRSGRAPACGFTSFYPTIQGMISQAGDLGIAGYVSQNFAEGAIGYVNYSYALGVGFPVAKVLNNAGYYTEPTPQNVAVSLLKAKINTNAADPANYLTQQLEDVYSDTDPRNYQLSSYSYFILPTVVGGQFNEAKGRTLGAVSYYMMCQAQQQSASLGYSPMPINLVQASFEQIKKIPGVEVQTIDIKQCKNPTFAADGSNLLADTAPQPKACDKKDAVMCPDGTAGAKATPTAVTGGNTGGGVTPTTKPATGGTTPGGTTPGGTTPGGTTPGGTTPGGTTPGGTTPGGTTPGDTTPLETVPGDTTPLETVPGDTTPGGVVPGDDGSGGVTPGGDTGGGQTCDPDTGLCTQGGGVADPNGGVPIGGVSTTTLGRSSTSGALVFLVAVLTLGVVLVPAYYWRNLSRAGKLVKSGAR